MEMDKDGNVDVFSAKSITMRAEEDFNIRADRNITMEAGQNIYMKAAKDHNGTAGENPVGEDAGAGGDIYFEARNDVLVFAKKNMKMTVEDNNMDINVKQTTKILSGGDIDIKTNANMRTETAKDYDVNAKGGIYQTSVGEFNLAAGAGIYQESAGDFHAHAVKNMYQTGTTGVDILSSTSLKMTGIAGTDIFSPSSIKIMGSSVDINGAPPTPATPASPADESYSANEAEKVTPILKLFGVNVIFEMLKGKPVREAIAVLWPKDKRLRDVKTIIGRWITREPCPEKKHKK